MQITETYIIFDWINTANGKTFIVPAKSVTA